MYLTNNFNRSYRFRFYDRVRVNHFNFLILGSILVREKKKVHYIESIYRFYFNYCTFINNYLHLTVNYSIGFIINVL